MALTTNNVFIHTSWSIGTITTNAIGRIHSFFVFIHKYFPPQNLRKSLQKISTIFLAIENMSLFILPKELRVFLRCTNLWNIWGDAFLAQNFARTFAQKFAMQKKCKILRTKLHKNNHSANVCTIFCANLCIFKQFLQKFEQKRGKKAMDPIR